MWEQFERIGLVVMLIGFSVLGWFGWRAASQNTEMIQRLLVLEQRLINGSTVRQLDEVQQATPCDQQCVRTLVSEAIATMSSISAPAKQEVIERVVEKVQTPVAPAGGSLARSQYIPLGAGDTTSTAWIDLPGAEVTLNIADFGKVKDIYFEAQLSSSAGLVKARLTDRSTGTVVIGSEISHVAGDAKLVSSRIQIPTGGRTIGVQLESEVQQPVKLLSSRLRVDVQ